MWLDGLYMAETFYARWTHHFDRLNVTAWDDILRQYSLIETHAHHPDGSGLLVHGWADGYAPWADPATGRAPHVWGRAVGWYFMSLVEVLGYFPLWHPGYWRLLRAYTSLARAVKAARDRESGSWWQVMEEENRGREGNFVEASASAMFTWGMFRGVRLGLLSGREFLGTARDAYGSLVDNFVTVGEDGGLVYEGTVDECNLANGDVNWDVSVLYRSRMETSMLTASSITPVVRLCQITRMAAGRLCWRRMSGKRGQEMHRTDDEASAWNGIILKFINKFWSHL